MNNWLQTIFSLLLKFIGILSIFVLGLLKMIISHNDGIMYIHIKIYYLTRSEEKIDKKIAVTWLALHLLIMEIL